MKSNAPLTPKQTAALAALLAGKSAESAAREAGVDPKTVRKWRQRDRRFKAAFRAAQTELLGQAKSLLTKMVGEAVMVLLRTMKSEDERLAYLAASDNFARVRELVDEADLLRRLEALEARKKGRRR